MARGSSLRVGVAFAALMFSPLCFAQDDRPVVKDNELPADATASKSLPVLWIAGDSTVRNNSGEMRGWGDEIGALMDPKKIQVMNRAIGGRSSRTFYNEGRWEKMLAEMKKGDIVLVQFGHNDVGALDAPGKFRGSIKGLGEETQQVKKPDGSTETVHSYGWYLRQYAKSAKAKGTTVVLCSPVPHKKFDREGKFVPDWAEWRGWVKATAEAEGVEYLDLAEAVGKKYAAMPATEVEGFFADKGTHTNPEGAKFNAKCVVEGLGGVLGKYEVK
ncbi:rhamnogalacturonan acetylesterase [Haloferula sp. BvORR071]|uniref:rhamnogalacturonan acetylesterase n=1 Tax=Haloferula sp. BvORR071 TaxID=1396141 RepID=UPI002241058F|nr:rhamnogalacturonan acetylesterase [Haloferula sp. BvORR071]